MIVRHTQNDESYAFTNFAVAGNPMFIDKVDVQILKDKLLEGIKDLCHIMAWRFERDQYLLVLKLKSREEFEKYYIQKKSKKGEEVDTIPESTYILSWAIRNAESGYALKFNKKYDRKGALFARRYRKILLTSKEKVREWVEKLKEGIKYWAFQSQWQRLATRYTKGDIFANVSVWWQNEDFDGHSLRGSTQNPP